MSRLWFLSMSEEQESINLLEAQAVIYPDAESATDEIQQVIATIKDGGLRSIMYSTDEKVLRNAFAALSTEHMYGIHIEKISESPDTLGIEEGDYRRKKAVLAHLNLDGAFDTLFYVTRNHFEACIKEHQSRLETEPLTEGMSMDDTHLVTSAMENTRSSNPDVSMKDQFSGGMRNALRIILASMKVVPVVFDTQNERKIFPREYRDICSRNVTLIADLARLHMKFFVDLRDEVLRRQAADEFTFSPKIFTLED